jgi:hypothetical protein
MQFSDLYEVYCVVCGLAIPVGFPVEFVQGLGMKHSNCSLNVVPELTEPHCTKCKALYKDMAAFVCPDKACPCNPLRIC